MEDVRCNIVFISCEFSLLQDIYNIEENALDGPPFIELNLGKVPGLITY